MSCTKQLDRIKIVPPSSFIHHNVKGHCIHGDHFLQAGSYCFQTRLYFLILILNIYLFALISLRFIFQDDGQLRKNYVQGGRLCHLRGHGGLIMNGLE